MPVRRARASICARPLRRGRQRRGAEGADHRAAGAARDDRGAEERLALGDRRAFVPVKTLKTGSAPRDAHAGRLAADGRTRSSARRSARTAAATPPRSRPFTLHGLSRNASSCPERDLLLEQPIAEAGQVQHLQRRLVLTQPPRELVAGHLRHHQSVTRMSKRVHPSARSRAPRRRRRRSGDIPGFAQHPLHEPAHRLLIVHDEYS